MFLRSLIPALLLSTPALALSCLPYGPVEAYKDAEASEDAYIVVLGTLQFDESKLPKVDWEHQDQTPEYTFFTGHFTGHSLGGDGFVHPFDQQIEVNVQCFGPWCGGLTSGYEYLAYLRQTEGGFLLTTDPCGGMAFGHPDESVVRQVVRCGRGGRCVSNTR